MNDQPELPDELQEAIEKIRGSKPSTSSVHRALHRAREIEPMKPIHAKASAALILTSVLACAALLTLMLTLPQQPKQPKENDSVELASGPSISSGEFLPNFENLDMGLDPNLELSYDTKRVDIAGAVPGPEDPTDADKIESSPEPAMDIPPPPGSQQLSATGNPEFDAHAAMKDVSQVGKFSGRSGTTIRKLLVTGGGRINGEKDNLKGKQSPKVWKRKRGKPTFPRVYVGNGNSLDLVSMRVTVTIDGPRARTLVDHVFHNPHNRQLEGTFEYPMPTGATPSYYAMFLGHTRTTIPPMFPRGDDVPPLPQDKLAKMKPQELVKYIDTEDWGRLQEARVVSKQRGLKAYEQIVRGRIDPALLEYAGGNTFRGRVFPIPVSGYNRVLIAYEELLPWAEDKNIYRFPLPDCELTKLDFTLRVNRKDGNDFTFEPKDAKKSENKYDLTWQKSWTGECNGDDVVMTYTPKSEDVQVISGQQGENGSQFVFARVKPKIKVQENQSFSSRAVFLLDTSLSENTDRFDVYIKLMQQILKNDRTIQQFNILTFNVGTAWLDQHRWFDNTEKGREDALNRLDGILLEGATDWSAVLGTLEEGIPALERGATVNFFVMSDGHATWGNRDLSPLVKRFASRCHYQPMFHCYRTGIGSENLSLYQALTRRGGGIFNCYTPAEMKAASTAHRKQCWQIERVSFVGGEPSDVLLSGQQAAIYPGGELIVTGRLAHPGRTTLLIEGKHLGKKLIQEYTLEATGGSELAARAWGEVAVASLLSLNDSRYNEIVTAYCQQFNIASRVASFLILENDADYKRLDLEKERGKTINGDLSTFLKTASQNATKTLSPRDELNQFLARINNIEGPYVKQLLAITSDKALTLPETRLHHRLLKIGDVSTEYVNALKGSKESINTIIAEAKSRLRQKDVDAAVQALSSIIEKHPGRSDALRLVGYRLLAMGQPVHAARLFEQVQRARPFEPHSYRDLARSLEACGKHELAAIQYEIILAGTWHNRFGRDLKVVVREEYARLMRQAIAWQKIDDQLANHFGARLENLTSTELQSDLNVTITWNSDATDIDLWVIEPDGTKCYYQHNKTKNGGRLSQDLTNGYGPERYTIKNAKPGVYKVLVNYFSMNQNLIGGETHVDVVISRNTGTKQEATHRHNVILKKHSETVEVTQIPVK